MKVISDTKLRVEINGWWSLFYGMEWNAHISVYNLRQCISPDVPYMLVPLLLLALLMRSWFLDPGCMKSHGLPVR